METAALSLRITVPFRRPALHNPSMRPFEALLLHIARTRQIALSHRRGNSLRLRNCLSPRLLGES